MLEREDRAVRIASGEAIALMFELGRLDKFSHEEKSSEGGFTYVETLKGKILSLARALSMEAGGKGSAKGDLNSQRSTFQDIVAFIEVLVIGTYLDFRLFLYIPSLDLVRRWAPVQNIQ